MMAESSNGAEQQPPATDNKLVLAVKVYAPFQVFYEGDASSVSAINAVGPFDILPGHHNFLCMLVPCDLRVEMPDKSQKVIKIDRALMHVKANSVVVFINV